MNKYLAKATAKTKGFVGDGGIQYVSVRVRPDAKPNTTPHHSIADGVGLYGNSSLNCSLIVTTANNAVTRVAI